MLIVHEHEHSGPRSVSHQRLQGFGGEVLESKALSGHILYIICSKILGIGSTFAVVYFWMSKDNCVFCRCWAPPWCCSPLWQAWGCCVGTTEGKSWTSCARSVSMKSCSHVHSHRAVAALQCNRKQYHSTVYDISLHSASSSHSTYPVNRINMLITVP